MILIQFLVSMIATIAFAVLFVAPKSEWAFCGISGAIGWIVYYLLTNAGIPLVFATIVATFALTIFSRILAVCRRHPATVYLLTGIFPLVPGAGIYYTAFYMITNEMDSFSQKGLETFEVACAIVLGIIFAFTLPQGLFNRLQKFHKTQL